MVFFYPWVVIQYIWAAPPCLVVSAACYTEDVLSRDYRVLQEICLFKICNYNYHIIARFLVLFTCLTVMVKSVVELSQQNACLEGDDDGGSMHL
jgi:hypothetical protein